jgi:hypothetical protein
MPPPPNRDDNYDDIPPPPPRHRFQPDDEEEDYDYERPRRLPKQRTWIDQQFGQTSMVILVLFSLLCGAVALVFAILGVVLCEDPTPRRKAVIVLVLSVIDAGLFAWLIIRSILA